MYYIGYVVQTMGDRYRCVYGIQPGNYSTLIGVWKEPIKRLNGSLTTSKCSTLKYSWILSQKNTRWQLTKLTNETLNDFPNEKTTLTILLFGYILLVWNLNTHTHETSQTERSTSHSKCGSIVDYFLLSTISVHLTGF